MAGIQYLRPLSHSSGRKPGGSLMLNLFAGAVTALAPLAETVVFGEKGTAMAGAALGAGVVVLGAAKGIGHLAGSAMEGIARQPEAGGRIGTNMIIAAALIEGFTFFALVICLQIAGKVTGF